MSYITCPKCRHRNNITRSHCARCGIEFVGVSIGPELEYTGTYPWFKFFAGFVSWYIGHMALSWSTLFIPGEFVLCTTFIVNIIVVGYLFAFEHNLHKVGWGWLAAIVLFLPVVIVSLGMLTLELPLYCTPGFYILYGFYPVLAPFLGGT